MVLFINTTDTIGQALTGLNQITGSSFMSILLIFILILGVAFLFRIPLEFTAILVMPFLIVILAFNSEWLAVAGLFLIFLGIILARNFFFNK